MENRYRWIYRRWSISGFSCRIPGARPLIGELEFNRRDSCCPGGGSAAVAHAQNAASLPAVTPGEVKAALATGPTCKCPNVGEVEYAMKELGIKSFTRSLFVKRLGKVPGNDVYATLFLSLNKKAHALKRRFRFRPSTPRRQKCTRRPRTACTKSTASVRGR